MDEDIAGACEKCKTSITWKDIDDNPNVKYMSGIESGPAKTEFWSCPNCGNSIEVLIN